MISNDIPQIREFLNNDKIMLTGLSDLIYTNIENLDLKTKDGNIKIIDYPFNED